MICTLGDLLLDVVVRLESPVAEDTDTYGRTHAGAGGQAANVAAWAAVLGHRARFVGKRARDPVGRLVQEELRGRGVQIAGPEIEGKTGTVVSIATPDGKRTMLTDRGVAADLRADELGPDSFAGCEVLHVPAYSLVAPTIRDASIRAVALAREAGATVSLDLSSSSAVRVLGVEPFRRLLGELRPETVFGTAEELALAGELEAPTVVRKLGALGCSVRGPDGRSTELAALPTEVVDTTGAGDAFAAGFLVDGVESGLEAAARCVATMGAMPA